MTTCTIPPKGWTCSRDAGHEGPCAASPVAPYEEYLDSVIVLMRRKNHLIGRWLIPAMTTYEFRAYLADAWLAGLGYSLDLIETEKTKR